MGPEMLALLKGLLAKLPLLKRGYDWLVGEQSSVEFQRLVTTR